MAVTPVCLLGAAYGVTTAAQNFGLAITPVIVAHIRKWTKADRGVWWQLDSDAILSVNSTSILCSRSKHFAQGPGLRGSILSIAQCCRITPQCYRIVQP